jgi:poly-beta-1,6-N-acetyl-D-glucosamine synthase
MAYLGMLGTLFYYFYWERKRPTHPPSLPDYPRISILIPCHNEGDNIRETIHCAMQQEYPYFEVIAINDGSTDNTADILDELAQQYEKLRVLNLTTNQGKAMGLRLGTLISSSEYLICIDGDALLEPNATRWIVHQFLEHPTVGAVTGNPRIRNRSTLLGKLQVGEFSSIIGLIKRAQQFYGTIFTISGVIAGFRKTALQHVGYWNVDMITEDIDISWRLQLHGWKIRYEPNALCWVLMPETLKGLWRQRLRWSQGGTEVLIRYYRAVWQWKVRHLWPLYLNYLLSIFWAYSMILLLLLWLCNQWLPLIPNFWVANPFIPQWGGILLGMTCLIQFAISLAIDGRYEQGLGRYYYWIIWYPLAFWFLSLITSIVATPKALLKKSGKRAIWTSPDRGIKS